MCTSSSRPWCRASSVASRRREWRSQMAASQARRACAPSRPGVSNTPWTPSPVKLATHPPKRHTASHISSYVREHRPPLVELDRPAERGRAGDVRERIVSVLCSAAPAKPALLTRPPCRSAGKVPVPVSVRPPSADAAPTTSFACVVAPVVDAFACRAVSNIAPASSDMRVAQRLQPGDRAREPAGQRVSKLSSV